MSVVAPALIDQFVQAIKALADEANEKRTAYLSATKKPDESWKAVVEANPDNEDIAKFLAYEEKVDEQIKALQEKKREARATTLQKVTGEVSTTVSDEDAKALKDAFLEAKRMLKSTKENVLVLLGGDEETFKNLLSLAGVVEVNNLGGGQAKSSSGDIVRLRIASAFVDGEPIADSNGKVTFTTIASHLKVDADILRSEAAKAAGVSSARDLPKGKETEFTITKDDKTHTVVITPAVPPKSGN